MENPVKMDDLGVPLFKETPICCIDVILIFRLTDELDEKTMTPIYLKHCLIHYPGDSKWRFWDG